MGAAPDRSRAEVDDPVATARAAGRIGRALAAVRLPLRILLATELPAFLVGAIAVPAAAVLSLALPHLLGDAVDRIVGAGSNGGEADDAPRSITWILVAFVGVATTEGLLRFLGRFHLIRASRRVEARIKDVAVAHLQRLPTEWFDRVLRGDVISRLTQDVELLRFLIGPTVLYGAQALVVLPGGLALMLWIAPGIALGVLAAGLAVLASMALVMPRLYRHSKAVQDAIGRISQRAQEDLDGARVWLAFGRMRERTAAMRVLADEYVEHNERLVRVRAVVDLLIHGTRDIVLFVVVLGGVLYAAGGDGGEAPTLGRLMEFLGLLGLMMWPLLALGFLAATAQRAIAAGQRIREILDTDPAPGLPARLDALGSPRPLAATAASTAHDHRRRTPRIEVRSLTFRYPGHDTPVLEDVSIDVPAGSFLGLVGPIGSGKSTLLQLLLRLYEPPRGTVFVDDSDVLDLDPSLLRARFAYAQQDAFLFSDTIAANVALGIEDAADPDADDARIHSAIERAQLTADVDRLADGVRTVVGERGTKLSGGQRQRVQLARVLAADRPALLLDDALSAVDQITERAILASLAKVHGQATIVAVGHRLSLVRRADTIHWIEDGRILESGTHESLLRERPDGRYATTWRRQVEASALEGPGLDGGAS
jgi:ATP-binding cassette subfamily B multidrug efflux pump